ncbi:MAG: TadE/TadG family type IV pilus assembly protein [Acidimicrobiia bacterium]
MSLRKDRTERGASLIEASILIPLLLVLAIGLSEIGFLVIDYMTVSNAAREGARTGAAAANYNEGGVDADDLILESVEQAVCNLKYGQLVSVSIFQADSNGEPTGMINRFIPAPGGLICNSPGTGIVCAPGSCPGPWAPANRSRDPGALDVLGVEVVFSHQDVTGLFPMVDREYSETAIMQIEPDTRGGQ